MADETKNAPAFEVDGQGNLAHLHGTALPRGLINTGVGVVDASRQPAVQSDQVVDGMYRFAEQLNRK